MGAGMYSVWARTVLGYRVLAAMMLSGLGVLMGANILQRVAVAVLFAACGWRLPILSLGRRAKQRALAIERDTPNLIDQIVVSLEAGIGFSAALRTSANRLGGPLGEEMRLALQEQRMGASLTESLQQVPERVDSANLHSFVRAVVQGERLGVSIGQVMRDLAVDMRKRWRQTAEEAAQKTPVKLLLPLVFLILPTIFIVVLVPPMLNLINGGSEPRIRAAVLRLPCHRLDGHPCGLAARKKSVRFALFIRVGTLVILLRPSITGVAGS
jgi:tight adherence protein C